MMYPILIAIFVATTLLVLALASYIRWFFMGEEYRVGQRLAEITKGDASIASSVPYVVRDEELSRIPLLNRFYRKLHLFRNLQRLIDQADLSWKVGELILMMLSLGGLGLLIGLGSRNPILTALFLVGGSGYPLVYVMRRRRWRIRRFTEQFPDVLDMMTSALRAGHGFGRALQLVATEVPDPAGMEFRKTFEEHNLGLPTREALINFTQRLDSMDLKLFATAVIIQRESGGNLTEVLTNISDTIRERFRLLGQIRIYTTQGRFTAWILGTLPIALGLIISLFDAEYVMLLFREPLGQFMLVMAIVLQIIGFIMIRKIVKLKVQ
jgi:tight adherence protein B